MRRFVVSASALALLATPLTASEDVFNHAGFSVHKLNDAVYEAVSEGAHGGAAFWCAAAMFAQVELKASPQQEIYVVRGGGPSETTGRRSAGQFTLDAAAAGVTPAESSGNLNEPNVGEHMPVNRARGFCG